MKKSFFIILFFSFLNADFKEFEIDTNSYITAVKKFENKIFLGTNNGEILEIQDFHKTKIIKNFTKVKTFFGDFENVKIFDLDIKNGQILALISGDFGKKNLVFLDKNGTKTINIDGNFAKAKFLDKNFIVLANLSGEIYVFDINKNLYKLVFNTLNSAIGDFFLYGKIGILGLESGEVIKIDFKNFSVKNFKNHKDRVYNVKFDGKNIISGGSDRKIFINSDEIKTNFLVYCVAINDKIAAYCGENEIFLVDKNIKNLGGKSSEFLEFLDKNLLFGASGNKIFYWSF